MDVCMCVCVHICMHACIYACMYVCGLHERDLRRTRGNGVDSMGKDPEWGGVGWGEVVKVRVMITENR